MNGSVLLVERFPGAKTLSVQVFAGNRGVEEKPSTHGFRHLLEHLVLKGQKGDLDHRLESVGIFFTGRTHRDAMQFEFSGRADQLEPILAAVGELLEAPNLSQEILDRERAIMVEEFALVPDAQRLSRTAWQAAYGEDGLDPFGSESAITGATPDSLRALHSRMFHPGQLVVVVAGDIDLKTTTARVRTLIEDRTTDEILPAPSVRHGIRARLEADDAFGEVRAALVSGIGSGTAATLCAAYALAAWVENAYVTYTPSSTGGLVLIGRTDANNALGSTIDQLAEADEIVLFDMGKTLARSWLSEQLKQPASAASLRGLLMAQAPHLRPETLLEEVLQVGWTDFRRAIGQFRRANAVIAVGTRR